MYDILRHNGYFVSDKEVILQDSIKYNIHITTLKEAVNIRNFPLVHSSNKSKSTVSIKRGMFSNTEMFSFEIQAKMQEQVYSVASIIVPVLSVSTVTDFLLISFLAPSSHFQHHSVLFLELTWHPLTYFPVPLLSCY